MVVGCGWVVQLLLFSFNFLEMVQCELQPAPGTVVMVTITHSLRSRHAAALIIFHIILLLAELSGARQHRPVCAVTSSRSGGQLNVQTRARGVQRGGLSQYQ